MGMTIDKSITELEILKKNTFSYMSAHQTFTTAIETMKKYQKIKEVMDDYFHNDRALMSAVIKDIERIIENGNDE